MTMVTSNPCQPPPEASFRYFWPRWRESGLSRSVTRKNTHQATTCSHPKLTWGCNQRCKAGAPENQARQGMKVLWPGPSEHP